MKIKFLILSCLSALFIGCANPSSWDQSFNPLDAPQYIQPTAEELHSQNVSIITSNPTISKLNEYNN